MRTHKRIIIGHHLILYGYGFWLPNDPRGSGSVEVRDAKLAHLGDIHHGRKTVQPPRDELKEFYRRADPLLNYEPVWFDFAKRQAIAEAIRRVVADYRYTVWACAIMSNHVHLCVRRHRDDAATMWDCFTAVAREAVLAFQDVVPEHPVWSDRKEKVFLYSPADVRRTIAYIDANPTKERSVAQSWDFVVPYNDWPFHRTRQ